MASVERMIIESDSPSFIDEQQFFNQVLGEVYTEPGSGLTADALDRCRQDYDFSDYLGQPCLMGVDVGKRLNVAVRERIRLPDGKYVPGRLWYAGEVESFADLDRLISRYHVETIVVDALPETHAAKEFALSHAPSTWLAFYNRHQLGHEPVRANGSLPNVVNINRTEALEDLTERFRRGDLAIPRLARELGGGFDGAMGEYYRQLLASYRTREQDNDGNWMSRWPKPSKPDHYMHAELYCMMAAGMYRSHRIEVWRSPERYDRAPSIWRGLGI
jgi:hypothetical protein